MRYRPQWALLGLGAVVVVVLLTYPHWRRLLIGPSSVPVFAGVTDPQREVLAQIGKDNREAAATAYVAMLTVVPAPTNEQPTPVLPDAQVILSGDFIEIDAVHTAKGRSTVYRRADGALILRFDDFSVSNAPGLSVYLSGITAPKTKEEMGGGVPEFKVGSLKGSIGNQQFNMPKELRIESYKSVVLYSEALSAIYSTAPLR